MQIGDKSGPIIVAVVGKVERGRPERSWPLAAGEAGYCSTSVRTSFFKSTRRRIDRSSDDGSRSFSTGGSIKFRVGADSRAIKFSVYMHAEPRRE